MAALEGMASAKPPLVSDFGLMGDMVEDERNGYIAKAGDVAAWRAAIEFFAQNQDLIPALGQRSFEKARSEFSSEKIAQEYLADFRLLMEEKGS